MLLKEVKETQGKTEWLVTVVDDDEIVDSGVGGCERRSGE